MSPRIGWTVNVLVAVVLIAIALALMSSSCTLVYIEGDGNSVSDTGGHSSGITLSPTQQPPLTERLKALRKSR